jgi:hypothetical protein
VLLALQAFPARLARAAHLASPVIKAQLAQLVLAGHLVLLAVRVFRAPQVFLA